jgi:high-affinity iron transporter
MHRLLLLFLFVLAGPAAASPDLPRLVQLIDYVGVDYRGAVANGEIISAPEYAEMRDFTAAIREQAAQLPGDGGTGFAATAHELETMVLHRAAPDAVAATAASLRHALVDRFDLVVVPRKAPDLARARQLYADNCASCHGADGRGDGIAARGMEPAPTDFHDAQRWGQRTLYGLYSTITAGVADTGMRAFGELGEDERWDLAFLVGRMAVDGDAAAAGKTALANGSAGDLAQLRRYAITTPDEAAEHHGADGRAVMAYLRASPEALFANAAPLDFARDTLAASLDAYRAGQHEQAYILAVTAYLEGFELVERGLDAMDPALRLRIETEMTAYRNLLREGDAPARVEAKAAEVRTLLDTAAERLRSSTLSSGAAFASAFVILLREGLEAILVVAALAAFLIKTERRDALPYLHAGWGGALLLGVATWAAAAYLIDFSGASREITEGVAALVATAVLFYVGFWMHSKTSARQWQRFIEGSVRKALSTGTLWGLAGLSFIAVYREVFETILFYQALWTQADGTARGMLLSGFGAGSVALTLVGWLILRYSRRLPLRRFFSVTGVFMLALAVVFAGKGIAALQEAGTLPVDPVNFPRVDLLGIYPNLQGLLLQAGLVLLAALLLWAGTLRRRDAAPA